MSQTLPHIQIEGRSGCKLEIIKTNEQILVRKYASNSLYNVRLQKQEQKQIAFNDVNLHKLGFYSPEVINNGNEDGVYWFEMHYVGGEKYSNYLTRITKTELDDLVIRLVSYFQHNIGNSEQAQSPVKVIEQKINDLLTILKKKNSIPPELITQVIEYLTQNIPKSKIYLGNCHGDFTLSNMLFTLNGRIVTFDLLDSFIESPIIDLVKLRQDTKYYWSSFIENSNYPNQLKIKQVLDYMDRCICSAFKNDPFIQHWEKYLTVFNFARILPYAKDNRDIKYLTTNLTSLINK